jgi:2-C-methyl-D-erythritol 2,4-cyclodiphosphate synthase
MNLTKIRIGEGWDTHALVPGRKLILGGVDIPFDKGLLGHSDTDAQFQGADSMLLLAAAAKAVRAAGYEIGNVDSTIIAQAPKMAPHIPAMRLRLAQALGVDAGQVNVKAKTAEKLGPVGQGQSIEARAVALLFS